MPLMRRAALLALLTILFVAPNVHASLIKVDFSFGGAVGPLPGPYSGAFVYDDLGTGVCMVSSCGPGILVPMLELTLNLGSYTFTLAQGTSQTTTSGTSAQGVVELPLGSSGWGPQYSVSSQFLPAGVSSIDLFPGGSVFLAYTLTGSAGWDFIGQASTLTITQLPPSPAPHSVPEAPTLLMSLAAVAGMLFWRSRPDQRRGQVTAGTRQQAGSGRQ